MELNRALSELVNIFSIERDIKKYFSEIFMHLYGLHTFVLFFFGDMTAIIAVQNTKLNNRTIKQ